MSLLLAHRVKCCGAAPCPELGVNRTPSPTVSIRRFRVMPTFVLGSIRVPGAGSLPCDRPSGRHRARKSPMTGARERLRYCPATHPRGHDRPGPSGPSCRSSTSFGKMELVECLNGPQIWSTVHRLERHSFTKKRCRPVVFNRRRESWLHS
jgi:hypothetical protein